MGKKKETTNEDVLEEKKETPKTPRKRRTKEEIENDKKKKEAKKVEDIEETKKEEKPKKETKPKTKKEPKENTKSKTKTKEEGIKITKYQKTVCDVCDDLVDYSIVFGALTETVDETRLTYNALICTCDKCGSVLDPLNIYEINQKKLDKEYRRINGILQQDEIINLVAKSKKTMAEISHLTGLNDFIIASYMEGLRPLKKNSDIIEDALSTKVQKTT